MNWGRPLTTVGIVLGFVLLLLALMNLTDRDAGRDEEAERRTVQHALRWRANYRQTREAVTRQTVRADRALAKAQSLRDSVRVVNDTTLVTLTDTVRVPQVVVHRLVADSLAILALTGLRDSLVVSLAAADSTLHATEDALAATRKARTCRLFRVLPCPSRRATAVLTAGALMGARLYLTGRP